MSIAINIHEAKVGLSKYLHAVEAGETIVLCRRNIPIAEIHAVRPAMEHAKRALVGPPMMRPHDCGPPMQLGTAEKSLERPLADEGVIRLVVRPVLLGCYSTEVELSQPHRALHQKPRRDLPHVMQRHECDSARWQQLPQRRRQSVSQRLPHTTHVHRVIADAQARNLLALGIAQGLRPELNLAMQHRLHSKAHANRTATGRQDNYFKLGGVGAAGGESQGTGAAAGSVWERGEPFYGTSTVTGSSKCQSSLFTQCRLLPLLLRHLSSAYRLRVSKVRTEGDD